MPSNDPTKPGVKLFSRDASEIRENEEGIETPQQEKDFSMVAGGDTAQRMQQTNRSDHASDV